MKAREERDAANERIDVLTRRLAALEEFVSLNVGVLPNNAIASPLQTVREEVPAPVPAPALTSAPADEDTADDDVRRPAAHEDDFHIVRSNVRPGAKKIIPGIRCANRFQIFSDSSSEEEAEVRLVGDSIVRGQLTEFCGRSPRTRQRYCIPGGGVDDVAAAVEEVCRQAPQNAAYVIHVGTNDVANRTGSEALLKKYRQLIRTYKTKSNRILISGILPRRNAGHRFLSVATSTNRRLVNLCREEGVGFINTWDHFYYDDSLFSDGVHLNQVGAARFGRLLDDAVKVFCPRQVHQDMAT